MQSDNHETVGSVESFLQLIPKMMSAFVQVTRPHLIL